MQVWIVYELDYAEANILGVVDSEEAAQALKHANDERYRARAKQNGVLVMKDCLARVEGPVPLGKEKREQCEHCNGEGREIDWRYPQSTNGKVTTTVTKPCSRCGGAGVVP